MDSNITVEPEELDSSHLVVYEDADTSTEKEVDENLASDSGDSETPAPPEKEEESVLVVDNAEIPEDAPAPRWVTELRRRNRELMRQNRELSARSASPNDESRESPIPRPNLAELDWDTDLYDERLLAWNAQQRRIQENEREMERRALSEREEWDRTIDNYKSSKQSLSFSDFVEAEDVVVDRLSIAQQNLILASAKNPALFVYALGKSDTRLAEFEKITDPVKFSYAIGELESKLKTVKKLKSVPAPEKSITGSSNLNPNDTKLDALRKDAEKTGDYTKVVEYKRSKRVT